jgi:peptide/nickel transport system ATP-binding protein
MSSSEPLIHIAGLRVALRTGSGRMLPVLRGVDLAVAPGESVGIVGESGSGKSALALAAIGYLRQGLVRVSGDARFAGRDMFGPDAQQIRGGRLGLIPQNAGLALTPTLRIGAQIAEALRLHTDLPASALPARVVELLGRVRLPAPAEIATRYPHQLSGGQQQRAAIAMALAGEPEALLLDEPTTGLDVTTQLRVLDLLRDLAASRGMAMIYVSHDLSAVARVCGRIAVMYAGEIVADGPVRTVLRAPAHPYARALIAAIPRTTTPHLPRPLDGRPPPPGQNESGCAFAPRCALAEPACCEMPLALRPMTDGQLVRCSRAEYVLRASPEAPATPRAPITGDAVLTVDDLTIRYHATSWSARLLRQPEPAPTVAGVGVTLRPGETVALVGESGSGKSSILKAVAGLIEPAAGSVRLADSPLAPRVTARPRQALRRMQLIFQNPDESLNPRQTVAAILAQPLSLYFGLTGSAARQRAAASLAQVRLGAHYLDRLPAQLSGGEKQRIAIARAFAAEPDIVLCDEVTSALDVSVQAVVLGLLDQLRRESRAACLFVSHDLGVVRAIADRVAVLYLGRVCEIGPAGALYDQPAHPYTEALLGAVLEPDPDHEPRLLGVDSVESGPPLRGCAFQKRCHRRVGEVCATHAPPPRALADGHVVYCHLY